MHAPVCVFLLKFLNRDSGKPEGYYGPPKEDGPFPVLTNYCRVKTGDHCQKALKSVLIRTLPALKI